MSKVFLSHSSVDKPFARKLAADLRANGHTVWIDEAEINIGDSLIGKIREGIDDVDFVAAILSETSVKSEWVKKELELASNREIEEKKVIVLPILIQNVELPGFLKGKLYGDFIDSEKYEEKFELLRRSLGDDKPRAAIDKEVTDDIINELNAAKELIKNYQSTIFKISKHSFEKKSIALQKAIRQDNEFHPQYAPINDVYAFEANYYENKVYVTLGYLFHALRKSRYKGGHILDMHLNHSGKWDDVDRMLEAYRDMISSMRE